MNPSEVVGLIRRGNEEFRKDRDAAYFKSHRSGQAPLITLLTCSDSRVQSTAILPDPINRIFSVENIGNQVATSGGSLDYGILHLKTPVFLIAGHSDCGAVKACTRDYSGEPESIKRELDNLAPAVSSRDSGEGITSRILANINFQTKVAMARYPTQIAAESLAVVGAYYDFANDLGKGYGRLVILSMNGVSLPF